MKKKVQQSLHHFSTRCYCELFSQLGCTVKENGGWLWLESGLSHHLMNGAISLSDQATPSRCSIKQILDKFHLPFFVCIEEAKETQLLSQEVRALGLRVRAHLPVVARTVPDSYPRASQEFTESLVTTAETLLEWAEVLAQNIHCSKEVSRGYAELYSKIGLSGPFYHVIGRKEGRIVSTGTVLCLPEGAYLYNVSTLKSERARGFATSINMALLRIAYEQGCTRAALVAPPSAIHMYQKMGFETISRFSFFLPPH